MVATPHRACSFAYLQNQFSVASFCVVAEIPVLPGCDSASEGSWFPSFRGNVVVSSSKVEMSEKSCISTLKNGTTTLSFGRSETNCPVTGVVSVKNVHGNANMGLKRSLR